VNPGLCKRDDPGIGVYLLRTARRYFSCREDQDDAVMEGWIAVCGLPSGMSHKVYCTRGANAIKALYKRIWRQRRAAEGRPAPRGT
jgi:hypothetical protein